jgi:hypothetical protein
MNPQGHPNHAADSAATKLFTVVLAELLNGSAQPRLNNFG